MTLAFLWHLKHSATTFRETHRDGYDPVPTPKAEKPHQIPSVPAFRLASQFRVFRSKTLPVSTRKQLLPPLGDGCISLHVLL